MPTLVLVLLAACGASSETPPPEPPSPTGSTGDTGTSMPPASCDEPAAFVGSGTGTLSVPEPASYCVYFVTSVPGLERLRRLELEPGDYALPAEPGSAPYRLPACVYAPAGASSLPVGQVTHTEVQGGSRILYTQPVPPAAPGGAEETLEIRIDRLGDAPPPIVLDGLLNRHGGGGSTEITLTLCSGEGDCRSLHPCDTPQTGEDPEVLSFARGELRLFVDVVHDGGVWIDPPRRLYRAEGTLDGTDFAQTDYFRLGYSYAGHGLFRDLLVRFEAPVAGACGMQGRYGQEGKERLELIDCEGDVLDDLGSITVSVP